MPKTKMIHRLKRKRGLKKGERLRIREAQKALGSLFHPKPKKV